MTSPTQAQIEAAAEKIWEDFSAGIGGDWKHLPENAIVRMQCLATARAALTAAAEVGDKSKTQEAYQAGLEDGRAAAIRALKDKP